MAKNNPADAAREQAERERFCAEIRAANRPASEAEPLRREEGPPYPKPALADVLAMPAATKEELAAKRDAAARWLAQFAARARFVLGVSDLRAAARTKDDCRSQIDRVRPLLSAEAVDAILAKP